MQTLLAEGVGFESSCQASDIAALTTKSVVLDPPFRPPLKRTLTHIDGIP